METGYPCKNPAAAVAEEEEEEEEDQTDFVDRLISNQYFKTAAIFILTAMVAVSVVHVGPSSCPKVPKMSVNQFSVSDFTVQNDSLSSTSFTTQLRLVAENPNKKGVILFGGVASALSHQYYDTWLSDTRVPPFFLHPKSSTTLTLNFTASGVEKSLGDLIHAGSDRGDCYLQIFSRVVFVDEDYYGSFNAFCDDLRVSSRRTRYCRIKTSGDGSTFRR